MNKKLATPEFKSEEEEALWWEENQDLVLAQFELAAMDGTLKKGSQPPTASWAPSKLRKTA